MLKLTDSKQPKGENKMKETYISLMAKALSAYTDEHIKEYFERVKREGLTEHGFSRLTANIGVLIAHGERTDLLPLFCEMMEFCCKNMPHTKAANDFSVREILSCITALEENKTLGASDIERFKDYMREITPKSYNEYAKMPSDIVHNWAIFTAASEYMREHMCLGETTEFVDMQIAAELHYFDENGMYLEPHNPMVYDLVPRGVFALMLHYGYHGKYFDELDGFLRKSGLATLKMQSVTGEIPFGGRSNQCLYNEALLAIVCEHEANRYFKEGNYALASKFKSAVALAMENTSYWLNQTPISHVKNHYDIKTEYGCENYAYFDKYMITVASYLYAAYLICDDGIPCEKERIQMPEVYMPSEHFHKVFLKNGLYSLEFDTAADPHYDASGLGRVHRKGAPSEICLSMPCAAEPIYKTDIQKAPELSLCAGTYANGEWQFASGDAAEYKIENLTENGETACVTVINKFKCGAETVTKYTLHSDSVEISVCGDGKVAYMLPAFVFDGKNKTNIKFNERSLEISYLGRVCRYATDGKISDTGEISRNRNGHYRIFRAEGDGSLLLKITIEKE